MKKTLHTGRLVAELRHIIGKSQSRFATMVGVSIHTIISVENGRIHLSKKLVRRILTATGAVLPNRAKDKILTLTGTIFTKKSFEGWLFMFRNFETVAKGRFDEVKYWIELAFRAAAKPGAAGNRNRLPLVFMSLVDWLDETHKNFKLGPEIDEILENETRHVQRDCEFVGTLKVDDSQAKEFAAVIGMDYKEFKKELDKHRDSDLIMLKYECFRAWNPWSRFPRNFRKGRPKTPKLMQKPKYWFKRLPNEFVVEHDQPITTREIAKLENVKRIPHRRARPARN
jgi:transcriptional regulator with XRE-family HTH domain